MHIDDTISTLIAEAVQAEDNNFGDEGDETSLQRAAEALKPWIEEGLEARYFGCGYEEFNDLTSIAEVAVQAAMAQHRFAAQRALAALGPCEDETGLAPYRGAILDTPPGWPRRAND